MNQSVFVFEGTTLGHAAGTIYSVVPASAGQGFVGLNFDVVDDKYLTITSSNFTGLAWYSDKEWTSTGNIAVISTFELFDGNASLVTWNTTGSFWYDNASNDSFSFCIQENPVSQQMVNNEGITNLRSSRDLYLHTGNKISTNLDPFMSIVSSGKQMVSSLQLTHKCENYFLLVGKGNYGGNWESW